LFAIHFLSPALQRMQPANNEIHAGRRQHVSQIARVRDVSFRESEYSVYLHLQLDVVPSTCV